jgi:DNA adenine methylase
MWKALQNGWLPNINYTEKEYNNIKNNKDKYPPELVGYAGFCLSYAGKWMGGWCRDSAGKRKYDKEAHRNISRDIPLIKGIDFRWCDYTKLEIPPNSLIYCDPPYAKTTKYSTSKDFDHNIFWDWCREQDRLGNTIFISEYEAPDDFECVWQKKICSSLDKNTGGKVGVEKLFCPAGNS